MSNELTNEVDSIHNYYKHLVLEELTATSERATQDMNFFADAACVALNRLPPRYIRHDVDMSFFMSPTEMQEVHEKVRVAVADAVAYVSERDIAATPTPVAQRRTGTTLGIEFSRSQLPLRVYCLSPHEQ